eukprot:Protomagalhaensia_sp_Gyna_25__4287@NODE_390_length_3596_cov_55_156311_g300_i0_p3_GENE_NODE_390_length_3596_cov_55_156311_g300_i0NODE_390_length_3596_cov_55_156311_g300_i0_p3_ORF_typecomplete_len146_score0_43_NODE_390_length_3596_cov_55_156311_g300_i0252689
MSPEANGSRISPVSSSRAWITPNSGATVLSKNVRETPVAITCALIMSRGRKQSSKAMRSSITGITSVGLIWPLQQLRSNTPSTAKMSQVMCLGVTLTTLASTTLPSEGPCLCWAAPLRGITETVPVEGSSCLNPATEDIMAVPWR